MKYKIIVLILSSLLSFTFLLSNPFSVFAEDILMSPNMNYGPASDVGTNCQSGTTSHQELKKISKKYSTVLSAMPASVISASIFYPLDLIRLRQQTSSLEKGNYFKGFRPFAAALCTQQGINLSCYDALKEEGWSTSTAGGLSGVVAGTLSNPAWVFRTKKTLEGQTYSAATFLKEAAKNPLMPMRGQGLTLFNALPNSVYYSIYEKLKEEINGSLEEPLGKTSQAAGYTSEALAAGTARCIVQTSMHPLETIKTNRQKSGNSYSQIVGELSKEGARGFYRGLGAATARGTVGTAVYMCLFKFFKEGIESIN